jgi:hypothetical protein
MIALGPDEASDDKGGGAISYPVRNQSSASIPFSFGYKLGEHITVVQDASGIRETFMLAAPNR